MLSAPSDELICFSLWPCEMRSIFNLQSQDKKDGVSKSACKWRKWKLPSRRPIPGLGSKPAFDIMALPSRGLKPGWVGETLSLSSLGVPTVHPGAWRKEAVLGLGRQPSWACPSQAYSFSVLVPSLYDPGSTPSSLEPQRGVSGFILMVSLEICMRPLSPGAIMTGISGCQYP